MISETLKGNKFNGILIALVPLITDLPIVLISIYLLKSIADTAYIFGPLSILGGLFLLYLGIQNLKFVPKDVKTKNSYRSSIKYGVFTNFLSPHPYLFWITIGAPAFIKAGDSGTIHSYLFVLGFYVLLIGAKITVALISNSIKGFLSSKSYQTIMKLIGIVLIFYGILLIYDGLKLL